MRAYLAMQILLSQQLRKNLEASFQLFRELVSEQKHGHNMTPQRQPGCNTEYIRIFSKQSTKDPIFEINPIFGLLPVFFGGDFFLFFRGFLSELFGIFSQQYLISDYSPNNIQRIQFWECILLTHGADMRRINMDFSIFVFSDDKIVDNVFVFSAPFYFHCPIGHVILKT